MNKENFQDIVIEDIKELIVKKGCYFCFKIIEYPTLGGFKTDRDNILDLQNPVCNKCWLKCDVWNDKGDFRSLNCVLRDSQGELTEQVEITWPEAVDTGEGFIPVDTPKEVKMSQCDHTYKPTNDNLLRCQKCNKEVSIMGN